MDILIVGAGVVGYTLAKHLSLEQHDIAVVDHYDDALSDIKDRLDVLTVRGDATRSRVLLDAGIEDAEMVIAVTDNDSVNLMICLLAQQLAGEACKKIARVRNPDLFHDQRWQAAKAHSPPQSQAECAVHDSFVDLLINPDNIVVDTVTRFVEAPGATEAADFAGGQVLLRKFAVPPDSPLAELPVHELVKYTSQEPFLVVAIGRGETTIIPGGDDTIHAGDDVFVLMREGVLPLVLPLLGQSLPDSSARVILGGVTDASQALAQRLRDMGHDVAIIEPDTKRAESAAADLNDIRVFHGKPTSKEILQEAGIDICDFFAALGEEDERNLLSALLARHLGAKRALMLTREVEYLPVLSHIGVDIALNARLLTMSAILRHVRRGSVQSVAKFHNDTAEVIEITIEEGAKVVGKPLRDVGIPRGILVGAVRRGGDVVIASGETVIQPEDRVIVFVLAGNLGRMEKLFTKRSRFLA